MSEPLDQLIDQATARMDEAVTAETMASAALIAAGNALVELRARVTDKASQDGAEWGHGWERFVKAKLNKSYSYVRRLIGYAKADDPEMAIKAHRDRDAAQKRATRGATTSDHSGTAGAPEKQLERLRRVWDQTPPEVRTRFMEKVGLVLMADLKKKIEAKRLAAAPVQMSSRTAYKAPREPRTRGRLSVYQLGGPKRSNAHPACGKWHSVTEGPKQATSGVPDRVCRKHPRGRTMLPRAKPLIHNLHSQND